MLESQTFNTLKQVYIREYRSEEDPRFFVLTKARVRTFECLS